MLGACGWGEIVSVQMPYEWRYLFITSAAAVVSPGGLGDGARVKACRKDMCFSLSVRRAWISSDLDIWAVLGRYLEDK